ncbi:Histone H4 [Trichoglossum hirsutum]|uniref:Histone H4 n=1 Tax=Trichoglossum hirsutum TaxID=265104 RepID=A0A9P8LC13_9PEZI|nr:Histone H4 [Trichoglossum hirsutum]
MVTPAKQSRSGHSAPSHQVLGGKGLRGVGGKGLGKGVATRRHRKLVKDTIRGITKGDIRRLARRGGVKRISAPIYEDLRAALAQHLREILKDCAIFLDHSNRKTITVTDVIFALKRRGRPLYGFDKDTYIEKRKRRH